MVANHHAVLRQSVHLFFQLVTHLGGRGLVPCIQRGFKTLQTGVEEADWQGNGGFVGAGLWVLLEVLEVLPAVDDEEFVFLFAPWFSGGEIVIKNPVFLVQSFDGT